MTDRPLLPESRSVFARLVVLMGVMAVGLLTLVSAFYLFVLLPSLHESVSRVVGQAVRTIATSAPDSARAVRIADSLGMEVQYVRSGGGAAGARSRHHHPGVFAPGHVIYMVPAPQGGHYRFVRRLGALHDAHVHLMLLLLGLIALVVLATWLEIRRLFAPLRRLHDGVRRLSEGDLDVEVPAAGGGEFVGLTTGFNQMATRVRDMVQARDQLLRDVSHELRSPLARLKVALALEPQGRARQRMTADVEEMEGLVTRLLEMERLRAGRGLATAPEDLVALAATAAANAPRPPGAVLRPAAASLVLRLDRGQILAVFRNLLDNAARHARPDSAPTEIHLEQEPGAVVVRVRDDGAGFDPEAFPTLFEPFARPDRARTRDAGGFGLGLSLCRRIVEAHGGTILARNHPPRGAEIEFRLPGLQEPDARRGQA